MPDHERRTDSDQAPPLRDYAFIADCHAAALVSREGSIDWCCMPRLDSRSVFARLLGWREGGYCRIAPVAGHEVNRRYLPDSLILETTFENDDGAVQLIDFMPMREGGREKPYRQLLRVVVGLRGKMELVAEVEPRFEYGCAAPWIRQTGERCFHAIGGSDGLLISGDLPLELEGRERLAARFTVAAEERGHLALQYAEPEDLDDDCVATLEAEDVEHHLEETRQWWGRWVERLQVGCHDADQTRRSAVVLKGLTHSRTGAIAAAATTSLPEEIGGCRNWDYRYTWIRDSVFTARALTELGLQREADGFRRFVERSAAGKVDELQVLYGIDGRHRLPEYEVPELPGYRDSTPVRIGNAAARQLQLDIYGELMDLIHRWHGNGNSLDDSFREFTVAVVEKTIEVWRQPDRGIWEIRGEPRHFVHSKALCWTALDRGLRLAGDLGAEVDRERWRRERDAIRRQIEEQGYDAGRGVFTQAYDTSAMDASLLLLPVFGFVDFDDERMVRTSRAVREELSENGLLRRYAPDGDGLPGREGAFVACTYWLAECLARQGQREEAEEVYAGAAAAANDLGLFAEEYDVEAGRMLGNFPQGLTHLSQIAAAVAITAAGKETA